MAEPDLQDHAPSRDGFDERVKRIVRPESLKSDEEQDWAGGRGTDVWETLTAAMRGDLGTLRKMVEKDPRLVNCAHQYRTPLHFAVQENQIAVVEFLLDQGADATYASGNYWHAQPAVIAEERGYHALLQLLQEHLASEAGVGEGGERIADAIRRRDVDEVRALLTADPDLVHAADRRGNMPMHWAVMIRSLPMIDLILEKGGEINAMRPDGARPLDLSNGDYYYRGGRDVPPEALVPHEVLIGYLIAKGAEYDIAVAAKVGDTARVRQLLDEDAALANAVPPYSTYYSGLPLRNACALGDVPTVRILLDGGADPNQGEPGIAPRGGALHAAASSGNLEIAEMLLKHGADPNAEVESSGNCMHIARTAPMRELLASYGGDYADYEDLSQLPAPTLKAVYGEALPLRYYVQAGDIPHVTARLSEEPDLAGEILEYAVGRLDAAADDIIQLCLSADPSAAKRIHANELIYMLHRLDPAQEQILTEQIRKLLQAGMPPNDADWLRVTALHRLAIGSQAHGSDGTEYRPHLEVMRLFIEAGADLNAKDEEYHSTPLGWAARWGRTEMVALLLERGARTNLPDDLPWTTPLAWAQKKGHADIEQRLRAAGAMS